MAIETTPVKNRFSASIIWWYSQRGTTVVSSQVGQLVQPNPESVRRTAAPVTMIVISATSAISVSRR